MNPFFFGKKLFFLKEIKKSVKSQCNKNKEKEKNLNKTTTNFFPFINYKLSQHMHQTFSI